jgi:uncharacterized membrane protein YjjP (DUF1212 family)
MSSEFRSSDQNESQACASASLNDIVEVLAWFGALMLRAGNPAFRTRECMEMMGRKQLGLDVISVALTQDSVSVSASRANERAVTVREVGVPGVDAWSISELEQLAFTAPSNIAPCQIAGRLAKIEIAPPLYSIARVSVAVGAGCAAFAALNGCSALEIGAAGIGAGIGQWSRSQLSRRRFNQYGVAALCAVLASGTYVLIAAISAKAGLGTARHPAGFISSVLFLVPGFPLVAALLDLLQYQTVAAVARFAYGMMIFLAATFGLSIIVGLVRVDLSPQSPLVLAYLPTLLLRGVASFVGGCAFAMLFNGSIRTVTAVGVLALGANEFRLLLHDAGMMLAPATFFGALVVGLAALLIDRRFDMPRMAITVPAIIVMLPGVYAFQTIVFFNHGQMLDAVQAGAMCGFVLGAMAMGLAVPRFFNR